MLEFTAHRGKVKKEKVPAGNVYVHGKGVGDVGRRVIAEREILGSNGFVLAIVPIRPKTGDITGKPELISRGFVFQPEQSDLMDRAAAAVYNALKRAKSASSRPSSTGSRACSAASSSKRPSASPWSWPS